MRSLRLLTAAAVAAAILTATALAHASTNTGASTTKALRQQVTSLRHGISWHRLMTWHFQDRAGVARTPTHYVEKHVRSIPFLRWDDRMWSHRRIAAARLVARSRTMVAHWALWNCIHNGAYPGAPHEGNSSSGTYTGPLQMTYPWNGFYVHWYTVPLAVVYKDAETAFRQHGYSTSWLEGQWPNTSPPCLGYA